MAEKQGIVNVSESDELYPTPPIGLQEWEYELEDNATNVSFMMMTPLTNPMRRRTMI
jgi:hypothetical protein